MIAKIAVDAAENEPLKRSERGEAYHLHLQKRTYLEGPNGGMPGPVCGRVALCGCFAISRIEVACDGAIASISA